MSRIVIYKRKASGYTGLLLCISEQIQSLRFFAGDLTVANSAIITLANGANSKNIFWVVAGSKAQLGTGVDFSGNILCKTLISLNTGAKVLGRLLAQTAVTLNASTVTLPH